MRTFGYLVKENKLFSFISRTLSAILVSRICMAKVSPQQDMSGP
jgi:hypothetical protein